MDSRGLIQLLEEVRRTIEENRETLDRLDAIAGDGDHGATMVMGWRAVSDAISTEEGASPAEVLRTAAAAFASVGGSIGPLWGTALLRAARAVEGRERLSAEDGLGAVEAASAGMAERGRSEEGDKTLLDVVGPASRELAARLGAGEDPGAALRSAGAAAAAAAEATAELTPRRGRASRLAERSRGHVDPGGASVALVWQVAAGTLAPT
ncbi:MAG: dihydroxyacetone kinase subunit L [Actinobacteria bacterium]|nr:dihydroxyacetone kinase subunit L [Actinomycetota bacterium]